MDMFFWFPSSDGGLGVNDRLGVPSHLATKPLRFATKFGCTHKIRVYIYIYLFNIMKKISNHISTYGPKYCLGGTLILSEPVRQIQDFRKPIILLSRGIAAGHGSIWKRNVTDKKYIQTHMDRYICLYMVFQVYIYIYVFPFLDKNEKVLNYPSPHRIHTLMKSYEIPISC